MKILFPFLLLLMAACSDSGNKTEEQKQCDTLHSEKKNSADSANLNFGKPTAPKHDSLMVDIPFDSSLVPEEKLQDYFRFVRNNKLILLQLYADTNLATGNPEMVDLSFSPAAVVKNVDLNKVPDSLKNFIGKKYHMIGENGKTFDAKIKCLKILVEFYPSYSETEMESGEDHSDLPAISRNNWDEGNSERAMLVGEIDVKPEPGMTVDGAIPAEMPEPVLFDSTGDLLMLSQLETDVKATRQFAVIQKNYVNSYSSSETAGDWTDEADKQFYSCVAAGSKGYATLTISAGTFCSTDFYADLTSVWETSHGKKNKLLFIFPGYTSTTLIFDIEGDGVPEILVEEFNNSPVLFKKTNGQWKAVSHFSVTDWRCPC